VYSDSTTRIYSMASDGSDEVLETRSRPSLGSAGCRTRSRERLDDRPEGVAISRRPVATFADISEHCVFWANDMIVSRRVLLVGNFGFDLDAAWPNWASSASSRAPPPRTWWCSMRRRRHPSRARHGLSQWHGHQPTAQLDRGRDLRIGLTALTSTLTARSPIDGCGRHSRWPQ